MAKRYSTDPRNPPAVNEAVAKSMRGNKAKDTKPELLLRKALGKQGMGGYRLHWKTIAGRCDIAYPGRKLAIYVHGCYWHRCPKCDLPLPKRHSEFWKEKFERNVNRDSKRIEDLHEAGWSTVVIWECELKEDTQRCIQRIRRLWKGL